MVRAGASNPLVNCPKCGATVAAGAKFCMNCGTSFDAGTLGSTRASRATPVLLGLGLLAVIALSLAATGALRLGGKASGGGLLVPGNGGVNGTQQAGAVAPNALVIPGKAGEPSLTAADQRMPVDIREWLKHLKRIDDERANYNQEMSQKLLIRMHMGAFNPGMAENDEGANADKSKRQGEVDSVIAETKKFFSDLTVKFNSKPAPAACRPIAAKYQTVLLETQSMLIDIGKLMSGSQDKALTDMHYKSYKLVDGAATEADGLVAHLCAKYKEPNNYGLFAEKAGSMAASGINLGDILAKAAGGGSSDDKAARRELDEMNK